MGKEWSVSWVGSTFGNDGNLELVGGSSCPLGTGHCAGKEQGGFNVNEVCQDAFRVG